jgi:hypothetical protein
MENCSNCGRIIGNLETPQNWQGHVVCAGCHAALSAAAAPTPAPGVAGGRIASPLPQNTTAIKSIRRAFLLISLAGAATFAFGFFEIHSRTSMLDTDYANNLQAGGLATFAIAGLIAGLLSFL